MSGSSQSGYTLTTAISKCNAQAHAYNNKNAAFSNIVLNQHITGFTTGLRVVMKRSTHWTAWYYITDMICHITGDNSKAYSVDGIVYDAILWYNISSSILGNKVARSAANA